MDTGPGKGSMGWTESSIDIYTPPCVKQLVGSCCIAQGAQLNVLWWPRGVGYRMAGRVVHEGGYICIYIADHWKRPWCWERLKVGGERDDRGWDGWMASLTLRIWIWANSMNWWWTGKPSVLQSVGSQRVGHDWASELITDLLHCTAETNTTL